jgi:hypothetical protein
MNSIANSAEHAASQVKEAATHTATRAKGNLMDFGTQVLKFVNNLRVMEMRGADNLLDRIGLQRQKSSLGPVLWFAAGAVTAGSVALVLSPTSGKELRRKIAKFLTTGIDDAKHLGHDVQAKVEGAVAEVKKSVIAPATPAESHIIGGGHDGTSRRPNEPKLENPR